MARKKRTQKKPVTAADVMSRDVVTAPADMDLRNLAKLFVEQGITGAPVVDVMGDLVGVVSETDLVRYSLTRDDELVMDSTFYHTARIEAQRVPQGFQIEDANTGEVADVMTPVIHSVTERATLPSIAKMMKKNHIHRVIVRRGKKPIGIISALDVLGELARA